MKIIAKDGLGVDQFGYCISSSSNTLMIGSVYDDDKATDGGDGI